jgi:DNA-binding MarR family transcriptional regulator
MPPTPQHPRKPAPRGSRLSLLFELFAAEQRVRTLIGRAMADVELRPDEYAVYSVLFDEGPHTPTDLARRVGMPPTTMSHYVRSMLERRHAVRQVVPTDRRSFELALTDTGLAVHAEASRAFNEAYDRFDRALQVDEGAAVRVLRAIATAAATADSILAADSMAAAG